MQVILYVLINVHVHVDEHLVYALILILMYTYTVLLVQLYTQVCDQIEPQSCIRYIPMISRFDELREEVV